MKKSGCYFILAVFMFLALFSFSSSAVHEQKLCVNYNADGYAICDASFSLYYIGALSGTRVIPDSTFSSYSVSYNIPDAEKMTNLALTLSGYILRDNIVPDYTGKTDANGITDFGGAYLPEGVYILMAEKHHQNDTMYFCEPTLIVLPHGESDIVNINVKYEAVPDDTETISISYKVLKAWVEDQGMSRPVKIEVELLRDGEVYDTVMLDESNNWRYQWDGLSVFYHWTVVEKWVSEGYKVMLSQDGKTLLLMNSGAGEEETTVPEESTTANEEATTGSSEQDKTTGSSPSATQPSQGVTEPELPVTGTLQWPVPYLACIGLLLFIVGYVKYRKSELADE